MIKVLSIVLIFWFLIFSSITARFYYKNTEYKFLWNGVIWVILDYYTIIKYDSNDVCMKVFEFKITRHKN